MPIVFVGCEELRKEELSHIWKIKWINIYRKRPCLPCLLNFIIFVFVSVIYVYFFINLNLSWILLFSGIPKCKKLEIVEKVPILTYMQFFFICWCMWVSVLYVFLLQSWILSNVNPSITIISRKLMKVWTIIAFKIIFIHSYPGFV